MLKDVKNILTYWNFNQTGVARLMLQGLVIIVCGGLSLEIEELEGIEDVECKGGLG